jgi:hypothetical protein
MYINTPTSISPHHIGGVMVGMLALSVLDRVVDPRSGQTKGKDYKIGQQENIYSEILIMARFSERLLINANSAIFQLYHG